MNLRSCFRLLAFDAKLSLESDFVCSYFIHFYFMQSILMESLESKTDEKRHHNRSFPIYIYVSVKEEGEEEWVVERGTRRGRGRSEKVRQQRVEGNMELDKK